MDADKLVTMANQIAAFHRRKPGGEAATEVAAHVERFWERRMRDAAYAHLNAGGAGLDTNAAAGLTLLREREAGRVAVDPAEQSEVEAPLEA